MSARRRNEARRRKDGVFDGLCVLPMQMTCFDAKIADTSFVMDELFGNS